MYSNYSASAGIFTRELGRMYWKKGLTEPSFDFIDKSIYFDFGGVGSADGTVGWFMYNFPNGPINLSLNESLEINFDIKFDLGGKDLDFFLSRQNGVRFGFFNSNNNIVNTDGFGGVNTIFSNYEGYTVAIGSSGTFRLVKRSKNPGDSTYSNLINSISPSDTQNAYQEILQNPERGFNLDPNPNITYQFKEIIERTSSTGLQITASLTSGNNIISSGSFTDNFNTSQFDNFVFRCNQGMVDKAIINNFNILGL